MKEFPQCHQAPVQVKSGKKEKKFQSATSISVCNRNLEDEGWIFAEIVFHSYFIPFHPDW